MKRVLAKWLGLLGLCLVLGLVNTGAKAAACTGLGSPSFNPQTPGQQVLFDAAMACNEVNTIVSNYGGNNNLAIQQLSTQSDIQLSTTVVSSPSAQRAQVSCIAAQRNGVSTPGCATAAATVSTARTTTDGPRNIGVTVNASWARAKQDTTGGQTGFEANTPGLVIAVDGSIAPKLLLGGALGWQKADMDFEYQGSDSGHLDSNTIRGMAYLNYAFTKAAYAEFTVGYGHANFDSERLCSACNQLKTRNTASYGGDEVLLSAGLGNSYHLSDVTIGAYARADYLHFTTDSYAEEGPQAASLGRTALEVDEQSTTSFTTAIGGQIGYAVSHSNHQFTPRARLEWVHEFANNSRTITSRFRDASGFTIGVPTASPERNWLNAGIGLDMAATRALSLAFDYAHLFKRDASGDQVSAKFKYSF